MLKYSTRVPAFASRSKSWTRAFETRWYSYQCFARADALLAFASSSANSLPTDGIWSCTRPSSRSGSGCGVSVKTRFLFARTNEEENDQSEASNAAQKAKDNFSAWKETRMLKRAQTRKRAALLTHAPLRQFFWSCSFLFTTVAARGARQACAARVRRSLVFIVLVDLAADAANCSTYCVLTRCFVPASVANRRHTRAMSKKGGR